VLINKDLCIGCGMCVKICPVSILYVDTKTEKCKVIDESKCDKRAGCEKVCSTGAIKIRK